MSGKDSKVKIIPPRTFYGKGKLHDYLRLERVEKGSHISSPKSFLRQNINGPTTTWKVFKKQNEALEFTKERKNGVMPFVFQHGTNGERLFLVAHPIVFWCYDVIRKKDRCSYEIIAEHTVCKLYFDLEFSKEFNPLHNGVEMTYIFIGIVAFYFKHEWNIIIDRRHVLDLDSSTETKFSRHLIYQLPNAAFRDNYSVGNFVKYVCNEVRECESEDQIEYFRDSGIRQSDVRRLFVMDSKGKNRLFCDENVYTKNRHFRLYHSTKWNKNAPLVLSEENQYYPRNGKKEEKVLDAGEETQLFLDSLITHIPPNDDYLKILEYGENEYLSPTIKTKFTKTSPLCSDGVSKSPYPEIDTFIHSVVTPGKIRKWFYFNSGNHIVYDIVGYRYCHNIGRHHRSNNIKYVVDLNSKCYYQKCYDSDCAGYRSEETELPPELIFHLEDGSKWFEDVQCSSLMGYFGLQEAELREVLDVVENERSSQLVISQNLSQFPTFGLLDKAFLDLPEC